MCALSLWVWEATSCRPLVLLAHMWHGNRVSIWAWSEPRENPRLKSSLAYSITVGQCLGNLSAAPAMALLTFALGFKAKPRLSVAIPKVPGASLTGAVLSGGT